MTRRDIDAARAHGSSLQRLGLRMVEFVTWWCWRRWRIYCPKGDVSHLFPNKDDCQKSLFDWDEAFVSPCTMNEINYGGFGGKRAPKIKLIGFQISERKP